MDTQVTSFFFLLIFWVGFCYWYFVSSFVETFSSSLLLSSFRLVGLDSSRAFDTLLRLPLARYSSLDTVFFPEFSAYVSRSESYFGSTFVTRLFSRFGFWTLFVHFYNLDLLFSFVLFYLNLILDSCLLILTSFHRIVSSFYFNCTVFTSFYFMGFLDFCRQQAEKRAVAAAQRDAELYALLVERIALIEQSNLQATRAPASETSDARASGSQTQVVTAAAPFQQPGGVTGVAERWRRARAQEQNVREQARRLSETGSGTASATPTFTQAGRAYLLADGATATDASLLPRRGAIYGSRVMGIPRLARSVDVRSLRTLMTEAGAIRASDGGVLINFNPCPEEEMEAQRDMGNNSYHLDLVELFVDPSGLGGDDTDLSIVATWGGETEFTRAWLGTTAQYLGNGSSATVLAHGVRIFYESANHHRDLQLRVGSTNSTRDTDQVLAAIYVGTVRQHTGPDSSLRHVISNTVARDQEAGRLIRAQQLGNVWAITPTGGFVPGIPDVRMRLHGNSVLEMVDPMTYRAVSTPDQWFTVRGDGQGRLNRTRSNFVSLPREEVARRSIDALTHSQIPGNPRDMVEEPRTSNLAGFSTPADILFSTSFMVPKDAKEGAVLSSFNILEEAETFNSQFYNEWFASNLFLGGLNLVCEAPDSKYCGTALLFVFDFYDRLDTTMTSLKLEVGKHFPHTVHILRNGDRHVFPLSLKEHFGHALHARGGGFCNPRVFVSVATGNQIESFDAWKCTINFMVSREAFGDQFSLGPVATWPPAPISLSRYLGPFTVNSGTSLNDVDFSIALGSVSKFSGGAIMSFPSAVFSCFQGSSGSLRFVLEPTCSLFCTAKFICVLVFGSFVPSTAQMWKMHHVVVTGGEVSTLPFDVPFGAVPNVGLKGARFICRPIGGVKAPKDFTGKYECLIHLLGIEGESLSRRVFSDTDDFMSWFSCGAITKDDFTLEIPARLRDFSTKDATFTMYSNGFSQMVGAAGFHMGEVELEFTWSLDSSIAEAKGWISLSTLFGPVANNFRGHYTVSNCVLPTSKIVRLSVGTFAGGTTANFKTYDTNSVKFHTNIGKYISQINVGIRPLPGFSFYGRSAIIRKNPP
ncbi:polyprotein 2 [Mulberry mosaic leaf roll associated virus]|uniref:Polyprotein 2 n=1 Tax=Mulberry mosaic leaf roll associated virus TaxID=1527441 RepID=A0A076E6S4_9SECO|nr:polyprotein 2 [Mulberry mosaic leaf roll associated virus]AII01834.1 polyprotein 2 [Mulberry mosaic leaf roll associated virus]